jgi:hypothetical protein
VNWINVAQDSVITSTQRNVGLLPREETLCYKEMSTDVLKNIGSEENGI